MLVKTAWDVHVSKISVIKVDNHWTLLGFPKPAVIEKRLSLG